MDFDIIESLTFEQINDLYDDMTESNILEACHWIRCSNGRVGCEPGCRCGYISSSCWYHGGGGYSEPKVCGGYYQTAYTCYASE